MAKRLSDAAAQRHARKAATNLPEVRRRMIEAAERLSSDGSLTQAPYVSAKCEVLFDLCSRLFKQHLATDAEYRGLIFVEQIALTYPLADLLNNHFQKEGLPVRVGAVSGGSSQSDATRSAAMRSFASGETLLLVCTNALEEGIDVSQCAFVVRFSQIKTAKSHIQGDGRARRADAEYFYFENNPDEERAQATRMESVARDGALALDLAERAKRMHIYAVEGVYPYGSDAGEVNLFNCHLVLQEYCSKVLSQSLNLQELSDYKVCLPNGLSSLCSPPMPKGATCRPHRPRLCALFRGKQERCSALSSIHALTGGSALSQPTSRHGGERLSLRTCWIQSARPR